MSKKIRDVVHDYIYLTPVEELITENPLFLRLHYIHQNSFTYLTYPSAHNTRFSHSLGVMHVAGELFTAAFARTPIDTLRMLAAYTREEFDKLKISVSINGEKVPVSIQSIVDEISGPLSSNYFDNVVYNSFIRISALTGEHKEGGVLAVVLLQAIRIAAMLHDVGHPPFSHIVEYALMEGLTQRREAEEADSASTARYHGHEHASERIASLILSGRSFEEHRFARRTPHFMAACAAFAKHLLSKDAGRLKGLQKTLLSGDLDADRLDYVLRDAKSAGLNLEYDLERLVDSAFLTESADYKVQVSYHSGALPTIENFFNARYDLYRWMIYHHDTTRRNLVVQRFIIDLLSNKNLDQDINLIATKFAEAASGGEGGRYDNYRRFLDSYFIESMWEINDSIERKRAGASEAEKDLLFYLDVILRRSNYIFPSVCKTPVDYAQLAQQCLKEIGSESVELPLDLPHGTARTFVITPADKAIEEFNRLIQERFKDVTNSLVPTMKKASPDEAKKDAEGIAKYKLAQKMESHVQPLLDKEYGGKYRVLFYYLGSFRASVKDDLRVFPPSGGGDSVPVKALSPTIRMLEGAWSISPQLMMYIRMPTLEAGRLAGQDAKVRQTLFSDLRNLIAVGLAGYLG